MQAGQTLFTLRLFSEYLQKTQARRGRRGELFKATRETELVSEQVSRLEGLAQSGAIPESPSSELNNQLRRQQTVLACRRRSADTRVDSRTSNAWRRENSGDAGRNSAPPIHGTGSPLTFTSPEPLQLVSLEETPLAYEIQELTVELGQQVQAGQLLAKLSNHQSLYVVGHAFKQEAPFLEQAAQSHRPLTIEFAEDSDTDWPALDQQFEIRHLANMIDPQSRTFNFYVPLTNQSRSYKKNGEIFLVWRFRPGQRTRLHVPVEEYQSVFVLPAAAVVREGPEASFFIRMAICLTVVPCTCCMRDRQFP
ncbi:MAG: HlyD family secretion protein [Planctomycetaceae bacterium]